MVTKLLYPMPSQQCFPVVVLLFGSVRFFAPQSATTPHTTSGFPTRLLLQEVLSYLSGSRKELDVPDKSGPQDLVHLLKMFSSIKANIFCELAVFQKLPL